MAERSDRSLSQLVQAEAESGCYEHFAILFAGAMVLVLAVVLQPLVVPAVGALMAAAILWRLRTLRRLCEEGVEVEALQTDVSSDFSGDTDYRTASYRYEYGGARYEFKVRGVDFFVGRATRHGERIVLLADPTRPWVAVFLRAG